MTILPSLHCRFAVNQLKEVHHGPVVRTQGFDVDGCGSKPRWTHADRLSLCLPDSELVPNLTAERCNHNSSCEYLATATL